METQGYIKIHRQIIDWEWYNDSNVMKLFIHILLKANHKDKKWRGNLIKRGSFITSLPSLSEETKLSVQQIRTALNKLISTGEITDKITNKSRTITVINYNAYQEDNRQTNSQSTGKQQTSNRQVTATNNDNNDNNENKEYITIQNIWNEFAKENNLTQVSKLSAKRISGIKARSKENEFDFNLILEKIKSSDFLTGNNNNSWRIDFDWIFNSPNNYLKVIEGKYDTKKKKTKGELNNERIQEHLRKRGVFDDGKFNDDGLLQLQ